MLRGLDRTLALNRDKPKQECCKTLYGTSTLDVARLAWGFNYRDAAEAVTLNLARDDARSEFRNTWKTSASVDLGLLKYKEQFSSPNIYAFLLQVASIDFPLVESTLDAVRESEALISPKVAGRCSPVSVLELPSEDGKSTPQILERIGADLQRQLNFLEFETVDSGDEQSKSLIFNDKASRKILKSLKKGDERDFLYLLDILTVSGIYAATQNKFFDSCYSPDNPVFPDVFDKLENEYNMANFWTRSERKLLFDHINSILAEVLSPCMDLCPWVKLKRSTSVGHGRLVDESWWRLVEQRKELSRGKPLEKVLDTRWLYLDDHVDMVGREVERMLMDDLLNELVSECLGIA
ncbi:uncharacterized protein LOC110032965 [Phalaenopsis equestris]|uniref:uncharacterized protein LOC110032965 n=1 Tax=Phalaenopsis equestris TaxID=78828 RepID=UPI0009E2B071|nr:uncharacterized protein LOC110032965 [Phalaenopsis equestris]